MVAKLKHVYDTDARGHTVLVIQKTRGKLNLDEITNHLLYEARLYGMYAIVLNASEGASEGAGWGDEETSKGDSVILYEILEQDSCPICGGVTPLLKCYHCGESLD